MGSVSLNLAGSFLALLLSVAIVLRSRTYFRLRHIPGPPFAAISEFWLLRKTLGGRCHLDTAQACKKYGSIVRVSPNMLVTDDPEVLKRLSAVRSPYTRSNWYDGMRFEADHGHVFSERNEKRHLELRTKMAAGYSGKENDHLEGSIDLNVARFVKLLESKYLSTNEVYKPVDLAPKTQYFTLDVIAEVAFGRSFGNLEADEDTAEYIKATEGLFPILVLLGAFPWMAHVFNSWPFTLALPTESDAVGMGKLMGIAKEVVGERFGPNKKVQRDMLGSWVNHGLGQREIQSEILLQIVAGSDSSALAIRATLLYIITNSRIQTKLLDEIANSSISSPITDAEARNLPYLQAIIKEGLRIMPPIPGLMLKEVPAGGDTLNGLFIPEGTFIGWSAFGLMRNEKLWGADANLFRPERWLEGTPEEIKQKEINVGLVFGYGKYQCLGQNVVNMELNKVLVEVLRRFEFTIVDPTEPWKSFMAGFFLQSDMWMTVTAREPKL